MRYLPKSDEERRQMLAEIGAATIDEPKGADLRQEA